MTQFDPDTGARMITHGGETLSIQAWASRTGIKVETIRGRLLRGWSAARALEEEVVTPDPALDTPASREAEDLPVADYDEWVEVAFRNRERGMSPEEADQAALETIKKRRAAR